MAICLRQSPGRRTSGVVCVLAAESPHYQSHSVACRAENEPAFYLFSKYVFKSQCLALLAGSSSDNKWRRQPATIFDDMRGATFVEMDIRHGIK